MRSNTAGGGRYRPQLREIARRAGRRLYISSSQEQIIVAAFRRSYLGSGVDSWWMGEHVSASPLDLWVYQEILHEVRPDVVVAVATENTRYLASLCQMYGRGSVMSPESPEVAREGTVGQKTVMVVMGDAAGQDDLAEDLMGYSALVTSGSYLIVEDTRDHRRRTVEEFLALSRDFSVDRDREKFYFTLNRGGFLRRH